MSISITNLYTLLQNPEPSVEFDTVPNKKQQHEVNVGKIFRLRFIFLPPLFVEIIHVDV